MNPGPPATTFSRYELISRLGRGGMGETWKARVIGAAGVTRLVVIKRIVATMATDERFIKAFIDEARITSTLNHGNIAQVVEFGEADGEYFLAIEYVEGKTLELVLAQSSALGRPRLPIAIACQVTCELLEGLHYAHTRTDEHGRPLGIVHRDISPDNVLLGFDGQVKVVDFGVAKARLEGRPATEPGTLKGKWNYFSPEQARTEEVDARSDLFAVGIVLYRMLCGRLPFDGHLHQALTQIIAGTYPPPRDVAPELPDALVEILVTALQADRERRFQSAYEMELRLRNFMAQAALPASAEVRREYLRALFAEEGGAAAPEPDPVVGLRPTVTPHPSAPPHLGAEPTLLRNDTAATTIDARPSPQTIPAPPAFSPQVPTAPHAPRQVARPQMPDPVSTWRDDRPRREIATQPGAEAPRWLLAAGVGFLGLVGVGLVVSLARAPARPVTAARAAAAGPAKGIELREKPVRALATDDVVGRGSSMTLTLDLGRHNLAAGLKWAIASTGPTPMHEATLGARGVPLFVFGKSSASPANRTGWVLMGGQSDAVRATGLLESSAFEFRPFERAAEAPAWSSQVLFPGPPPEQIELPVQISTEASGGFIKLRWAQPISALSFAFGPSDALREAVVSCRGAGKLADAQRLRGMSAVSFDAPAECAVGLVDDPAATGEVRLVVTAR